MPCRQHRRQWHDFLAVYLRQLGRHVHLPVVTHHWVANVYQLRVHRAQLPHQASGAYTRLLSAQPEPSLSLKPRNTPTYPSNNAHVKPKVQAPARRATVRSMDALPM